MSLSFLYQPKNFDNNWKYYILSKLIILILTKLEKIGYGLLI